MVSFDRKANNHRGEHRGPKKKKGGLTTQSHKESPYKEEKVFRKWMAGRNFEKGNAPIREVSRLGPKSPKKTASRNQTLARKTHGMNDPLRKPRKKK